MAGILDNLQAQIDNINQFLSLHANSTTTAGYSNHNGRIFRVEVSINPFVGVVIIQVTATDTMKSEGVSENFETHPISVSRLKAIESVLVQYIVLQESGSVPEPDFQ